MWHGAGMHFAQSISFQKLLINHHNKDKLGWPSSIPDSFIPGVMNPVLLLGPFIPGSGTNARPVLPKMCHLPVHLNSIANFL